MDFDTTPSDDVAADPAGDTFEVPPVPGPGEDTVIPYDWDGDGTLDSMVGYLEGIGSFDITDVDGDGDADWLSIDTDGDGVRDILITALPSEEGVYLMTGPDGVTQQITADQIAQASPALWELIQMHYGDLDSDAGAGPDAPSVEVNADPGVDVNVTVNVHTDADGNVQVDVDVQYPTVEAGHIVGDPFQYSDEWFEQSWDGSCVPANVAQIYNLYTGADVSDLDFVQLANEVAGADGSSGWIVGPDGVPGLTPKAAADLLEAAGIPATATFGSMDTLDQALAEGYGVMVAFDYGEIDGGESTDHMAVVSAIDHDAGVVYLSDPGNPDGNMQEVPLEVFQSAWADSDYLMVECTQSLDEFQEANGIVTDADDAAADADDVETEAAGAGQVAGATIVSATAHPWSLLPISGATLAAAARG